MLFLANIKGWVEQHKALTIVAVLSLVLAVIFLFLWSSASDEAKRDQLKGNIAEQNGVNAVVGNLIANQQQEVINAEINANIANSELTNSIQRDSNSFAGNATDEFCKRFRCDSSCREWRRLRNITCDGER